LSTISSWSKPAGIRRVATGKVLFRVAAGAERDAVTDDRTDCERNPEPTENHKSQKRRQVHACIIGGNYSGCIGRTGYFECS
jgi:hypothetical protein